MRGEVEKKTPKKEMYNPSFYDVTLSDFLRLLIKSQNLIEKYISAFLLHVYIQLTTYQLPHMGEAAVNDTLTSGPTTKITFHSKHPVK